MRSAGIVLAMLAAAALLPACGDERPAASDATAAATQRSTPASAGPRGLARSALVRLDDFAADWDKADVPVPDVRCGGLNPYAGARVISGSQRIVREQVGVQETVAVFPRAATSGRAYARINAPPAMRCLRVDVRREISDEAGAQASQLEVARIEDLGRWEKATRFSATAPSSIGEVRGSIDAVHLRVGRALGALVIVSGIGPVEEAFYDRVVRLFARRLHGAFG